jgi:ApbE superfamily uncharacterized protein (UPF0280 family)
VIPLPDPEPYVVQVLVTTRRTLSAAVGDDNEIAGKIAQLATQHALGRPRTRKYLNGGDTTDASEIVAVDVVLPSPLVKEQP